MGIGIKELLVILVIAIIAFGTKKLRNLGTDLGESIKGFRNALKEGEQETETKLADNQTDKNKENV
jgi:sec-independent protein translocase protein TatA